MDKGFAFGWEIGFAVGESIGSVYSLCLAWFAFALGGNHIVNMVY